MPLLSPPFSQLSLLSWCHMVWNIPLVSLGQLSWLCPLPRFCPPHLLVVVMVMLDSCEAVWALLLGQPKHWGVINSFLATDAKHSTVLCCYGKNHLHLSQIQSIPVGTSPSWVIALQALRRQGKAQIGACAWSWHRLVWRWLHQSEPQCVLEIKVPISLLLKQKLVIPALKCMLVSLWNSSSFIRD